MAAVTSSSILSAMSSAPAKTLCAEHSGLRLSSPLTQSPSKVLYTRKSLKKGNGALSSECGYLGSTTNIIFIVSTTLSLVSGRFGLIPATSRNETLKLANVNSESKGDPTGFDAADVLAYGAFGHIIAAGIALGLAGPPPPL